MSGSQLFFFLLFLSFIIGPPRKSCIVKDFVYQYVFLMCLRQNTKQLF